MYHGNKIKIITVLSILSLLSMLTVCACSSGSVAGANTADTGSSSNQSQTTAVTTTNDGRDKSDLPSEYDLKGYTLRVASRDFISTNLTYTLLAPEEQNGEILNDAIYERNARLCDKYNFNIKIISTAASDPLDQTIKNILAGDDVCDIALTYLNSVSKRVAEGLFINLYDVPNLDLSKNYWNKSMTRDLSLNGKLYFTVGDILVTEDDVLMMTMYNRALADDFKIENLYDTAYAGAFTYDKMIECMKKVIADLNNDGVIDRKDRVGLLYASNNAAAPYFASSDAYIFKKDSSDMPGLVADNQRASQVFDTVISLLTTPGNTVEWTSFGGSTEQISGITSMIDNKQVLFQNMILSQVRRFYRDITADFGLLPLPKYDESQESYSTTVYTGFEVIAVPMTNAHTEETGFILEALAADSYDITDTYYNVCMESKYTRDAQSFDMIKLAKEKIIFDMGFVYDWGGLGSALNSAAQNKSGTFASLYASNETKAVSAMNQFLDKLK